MKYYFLFLSFFIIVSKGFGQNKPDTVEQYCIVKCYSFSGKDFKADFDFGDKVIPIIGWGTAKDSSGNKMKFRSEADVLNHLGKNGWKLVTAYPRNDDPFTKFVFKKNS